MLFVFCRFANDLPCQKILIRWPGCRCSPASLLTMRWRKQLGKAADLSCSRAILLQSCSRAIYRELLQSNFRELLQSNLSRVAPEQFIESCSSAIFLELLQSCSRAIFSRVAPEQFIESCSRAIFRRVAPEQFCSRVAPEQFIESCSRLIQPQCHLYITGSGSQRMGKIGISLLESAA